MLKKENRLLNIFKVYKEKTKDTLTDSEYVNSFYNNFLAGETTLFQSQTIDQKVFDEEWIKTVESYFPSLNVIVMNPRSNVKREEVVVETERARKVDSQSIKHLAANTQLLREVRDNNEVIPNKILSSYSEFDYHLYENRFIMTLINRLFYFVKARYEIIKQNVESYERRNLSVKSNFPLNQTTVEFDLNITLIDESPDKEQNEYNKMLLARVKELDRLVTSLKNHRFMDLMKNAKKVYAPIQKTNLIMKEYNYNNAYLLWLFLDRYNTLPFALNVQEADLELDLDYLEDIKQVIFNNVGTVIKNQVDRANQYDELTPRETSYESVKILTENPSEIELPIEDIEVENNHVNEYYFEAFKKLLKESVAFHEENSKTAETAVKRALRQTIEISNSLYRNYFDLEEETAIFEKLITEIDVIEEIKKVKYKIFISNMVREVKEVDYNNTIRQERKLINELKKYYKLLKDQYEHNLFTGKNEIEEANELLREEHTYLKEQEMLALELENVKALKEQNDLMRKEHLAQFNEYQRELNQQLKEELAVVEKAEKAKNKQLFKELEDQITELKVVHETKLNEQKEILEEEFRLQFEETEKLFNEKLEFELAEIKEHYENKLTIKKAKVKTQIELEKAKAVNALNALRKNTVDRRSAQLTSNRDLQTMKRGKLIREYERKLKVLEKWGE